MIQSRDGRHFCNAPTSSFHQNLILVQLLIVAQRSRPSKCAQLSAPKKGLTVSDFSQPSIPVMPRPLAQGSRPSKCARLTAPQKGPVVSYFSQPSIFVMPRPVACTEMLRWWICSQWLRDLGPPSVLKYPPPKKSPLFRIFVNQAFL